MHYMLMYFEDASAFAQRDDATKAPAYWASWTAYVDAIARSGVMVSGNGLQQPRAATTVRLRDGKRQVQDGPFADTKEQLGGYFVIDVPDLDAALEWAARSPAAAYGTVEVRPVLPPMNG
jgi:hypothetical protein